MTIFAILYVVVAVLLLFGASIFVHEFGHFWVALKRGMKVEEFAIGFGPKVFGWTRNGIVYSWRWIPAGGFVKLPQMITSEAIEGDNKKKEEIPPASPLDKILVAVAGPVMNVVFAFLVGTVIYFVGLPVPVNPSIVGHVDPDSEEYKLGVRAGDRIISVNGEAVHSWQEVYETTILARTNVLPVVMQRGSEQKTFQLTANTDNALQLKMLNLDSEEKVVVGDVSPDSPAAAAMVQPKDEIISFAGIPVIGKSQLSDLIGKRGGETSELVVQRGGQRVKLSVTPRVLDAGAKKARIGIAFANTPTRYEVQRPGPTPWALIGDVLDQMVTTFGALAHSKQTGVGAKDLSGPVGILAMLGAQVNTDYRLALRFLVLLNVNLAILNLLPVPVLDGGHIMMSVIEKIRRRPMSVRFVEYTTTAFAVLLISFMLYVTFFDIKRISFFKSMFHQDSQIEPAAEKVVPAPAK
jgi:regulator of sigma E protease